MGQFVKNGLRITPIPKYEKAAQCDLESGKIYDLKWDNMMDICYLEENGNFNMPSKIYETKEDTDFINRVLTHHKQENVNTTGVLLSGMKGGGKSMIMKQIALKSELPIIVVHNTTHLKLVLPIFNKFNQSVCILFDEIEKDPYYWPTDKLLTFLDGVEETCKKLVIMTCNSLEKVDKNLIDRCSRVRYNRKYEADSNKYLIPIIAEDKIKDENKRKEVIDFITNNIKILSFDNINSFINEVITFKDLTLEQIAKDMNISLKD